MLVLVLVLALLLLLLMIPQQNWGFTQEMWIRSRKTHIWCLENGHFIHQKVIVCSQNCRFEPKKSGFMLRPNCARVDQLLRLGSGRSLDGEAKMLWILMEFWKIHHWLYCLWRVDKFWWSDGLMNGHNWVNFRPPSKLGGLNLLVGRGRRSLPSVYLKQKGRT